MRRPSTHPPGPRGDSFEVRVLAILRGLRPGEVVTYGEVAAEAGSPGAGRAVGNVVAGCDDDVPWWRVVTSTGRLVPGHEAEQARRLSKEGVATPGGRVPRARQADRERSRRPPA
jgi:methylated-DNA-protein-cysteine methyltransferase-like protein